MRFEQLDHFGQMRNLKRLHRYINECFFENSLNEAQMDIENLPEGVLAMFYIRHVPRDEETISLSYEFMEELSSFKTQKEQTLHLGGVILHEMIHQYCYENGIDDKDHAGQWSEVAEKHGLISRYEDGEPGKENVPAITTLILSWFRIR